MAKTRAQRKAERRAREAREARQRDGRDGSDGEGRAQHETQVPESGATRPLRSRSSANP